MIAQLIGKVASSSGDAAIIDVRGVGYKVFLGSGSVARLPRDDQEVRLFVTTVVREDSISLYGFMDEAEQKLFELLLTVSGVGPRVALNILSFLSVQEIVDAIATETHVKFNQVSGIGNKTAQRIVIELRDKAKAFVCLPVAGRSSRVASADDAAEALVALGYARSDARQAVEAALKGLPVETDAGGLVTAALKLLSRG